MRISFFTVMVVFLVGNVSNVALQASQQAPFELLAAGILFVCNRDSKKTAIFGKEVGHGFEGANTYDYFSGSANFNELNSWQVALREGCEESIAEQSLGASDYDLFKKAAAKNICGRVILAMNNEEAKLKQYGVMYLVEISEDFRDKLFNNFNNSRTSLEQKNDGALEKFLEKERLVEVSYESLLAHVHRKESPINILRSTSTKEDGKIELRDIFSLLLGGIKQENQVLEDSYIIAKNVAFNGLSYDYNEGFDISESEKQWLIEKVKADVLVEKVKADVDDVMGLSKTEKKTFFQLPQFVSQRPRLIAMGFLFLACIIMRYYANSQVLAL